MWDSLNYQFSKSGKFVRFQVTTVRMRVCVDNRVLKATKIAIVSTLGRPMASSRAADEGALLKAILQESATEVMVFDVDSLQIVQANPAAVKNLHYRPKALQKLTPLDFLP